MCLGITVETVAEGAADGAAVAVFSATDAAVGEALDGASLWPSRHATPNATAGRISRTT
jgi:hypothetical protein